MHIPKILQNIRKINENNIPHLDLYLLIAGFLIRLALSPFTRDPWDMDTWTNIGSAILAGHNPYALPFNALVYPPLWAIFCTTSYLSYTITKNPFISYLTLKLPIITADILICIIIRKIVYNITNDNNKARTAMLLYLLNPVTIIFSSLWGMFDAIPALLALQSLIYLSQNKYLKSSLTLGIGIGFKGFFPALLLPLFTFYVWKKGNNLRKTSQYVIHSIIIPLAISIPFLVFDTNSYVGSFIYQTNKTPQSMTYWFLIRELLKATGVPTNLVISLGFSLFTLAFTVSYVLLIKETSTWSRKKEQLEMSFLLKGAIFAITIFLLTSSTVGEQYIIWILPFMVVYSISYNQSLKPLLLALSGINIFYVALNVGPRFFTPITEMPLWWISFQYSFPSLILMITTGILFSVICATIFRKMMKTTGLTITHVQTFTVNNNCKEVFE